MHDVRWAEAWVEEQESLPQCAEHIHAQAWMPLCRRSMYPTENTESSLQEKQVSAAWSAVYMAILLHACSSQHRYCTGQDVPHLRVSSDR